MNNKFDKHFKYCLKGYLTVFMSTRRYMLYNLCKTLVFFKVKYDSIQIQYIEINNT